MEDSGSGVKAVPITMAALAALGTALLAAFVGVTAQRLPPAGSSAQRRLVQPLTAVFVTALAVGAAALVLLLYTLPRQPQYEPLVLLVLAFALYAVSLSAGAANAVFVAEAREAAATGTLALQ